MYLKSYLPFFSFLCHSVCPFIYLSINHSSLSHHSTKGLCIISPHKNLHIFIFIFFIYIDLIYFIFLIFILFWHRNFWKSQQVSPNRRPSRTSKAKKKTPTVWNMSRNSHEPKYEKINQFERPQEVGTSRWHNTCDLSYNLASFCLQKKKKKNSRSAQQSQQDFVTRTSYLSQPRCL